MANDNETSGTATEATPVYVKKYKGEFDTPSLCNKCVPVIDDEDDDDDDLIDLEEESFLDSVENTNWEELAEGVKSDDYLTQLQSVYWIRRLLSICPNPPIAPILNSGVLPELIKCLERHENPSLQLEAAWALTNIVSGNTAQTNAVVSAGAVPLFINLLYSPHQSVSEQAVWALANIIGDGPQLKEHVMRLGILHPLLSLVKPGISTTFLRNATWVIVNLCRYPPPPRGIMPALNVLINQTDKNILYYTIWALNFTAQSGKERLQLIFDFGMVEKLIDLLGHTDAKIISTASKAVETIVLESEDKSYVYKDALKYFPALLTHSSDIVVKEAHYFLLNTTVNNPKHVQAAIDANVLPALVKGLTDGDFELQTDAAKVIYNMTYSGSNENMTSMIEAGVLKPFCDLLACKDPQVVFFVLVTVNRMFDKYDTDELALKIEECGGLEKLEELVNHENDTIFDLADDMLEKYFAKDDDYDEEEDEANKATADPESPHDSARSSLTLGLPTQES